MNDLGKTIAICVMFLSMTTLFVLRGPLGRALADRLAGRSGAGSTPETERLLSEVDSLKERVAELEERLDFAERMLARQRDAERIGPGGV